MKKSKQIIILAISLISFVSPSSAQTADNAEVENPYVFMADPYVLEHDGIYYLYGTSQAHRGIQVYQSTDLDNWIGPVGATDGFALEKKDVFGEKAIMGAYVVKKDEKFYFYYVATDRPVISVAISDSPLGPFKQEEKKPLNLPGKSIAPHVFTDDDGKSYMYYTKLQEGNKIFVAEMEENLLSIKKKYC